MGWGEGGGVGGGGGVDSRKSRMTNGDKVPRTK